MSSTRQLPAAPTEETRLPSWRGVAGSRPVRIVAAGFAVALLSWRLGMVSPGPGLDASWNGGLAMAVEQGLDFGSDVVFTYGPLGFLNNPFVWFGDLSVLAFLYLSILHVGLCVGLVWVLARRLPLLVSAALAFLALTLSILFEPALLVPVIACVWLLERERSPRALDAFVVAAAGFAGVAVLVKLSVGPLTPVLFLIALVGARAGRWRIALFVAIFALEALALWLATGQSLADVPAFIEHTLQISSGYSEAMLRDSDVPGWQVVAATLAIIAISLLIVLAAWLARYRDQRARWAGVAVIALATFALYKEGVVRTDAAHLTLYFFNAAVIWLAVGLSWARWRWMLAAGVAIGLLSVPVRPPAPPPEFDVVANVRLAAEQVRTLFSPGRRAAITEAGRAGMQGVYQLEPGALAALRGRTVAVEPWEIGAAWAYDLDWKPLPVFQDYSAYTAELDRLNAEMVEDPDGPERILRENEPLVYPEFPDNAIDGRYPGWDPPEQARAVLCNFAPLYTSERWQVLGRVADRCGAPRPLGSVEAAAGEAVEVPAPGAKQVVFARIDGAGVSGLERLTTTLLHAAGREIVVDGTRSYRLIPDTAGDGLLLRAGPAIAEPGPLWEVPEASTIAVEGGAGDLTFSFYEMDVRPVPPGRSPG